MNVTVLLMKTCKAGVPIHQTSYPMIFSSGDFMKDLMAEVLKPV
jgi:hypothetical protein